MHKKISSFGYFGGKSARSGNQINQWIVSLLPTPKYNSCYCEPFAGMLGVLLSRPIVKNEIANDSSDRIFALWKAIRDQPQELFAKLDKTLYHESEFNHALQHVDSLDGLEKAHAVAVIMLLSLHKTAYSEWFSVTYLPRRIKRNFSEQFFINLHQRIKDVQFMNTDALKLMKRVSKNPEMLVYADPPYENASTHHYGKDNQIDHGNLKDMLSSMAGKVAISGYGDSYDDLGCHRHEKKVNLSSMVSSDIENQDKRTEVLWTNYDPGVVNRSLFDEI